MNGPTDSREIASDEPLDLVVRLRAAADKSANGGGEWYQLIHRCREAADHIEKLRGNQRGTLWGSYVGGGK